MSITPPTETDLVGSRARKGKSQGKQEGKRVRRRRQATAGKTGPPPWTSGEPPESWAEWVTHLENRKSPAPASAAIPRGKLSPICWAIPGPLAETPLVKQLDRIARGKPVRQPRSRPFDIQQELEGWLSGPTASTDLRRCLECLAWSYALRGLARLVHEEQWEALLETLRSTAEEASALSLSEHPLAHQLLTGELALVIAWEFPEFSWSPPLWDAARRNLSEGVGELLDGEGVVHGRHFGVMRPLLACWTRCGHLGRRSPGGCFETHALEQYTWLVQQALRFTGPGGVQMLANGVPGPWQRDLVVAALELGDDRQHIQLARAVLPDRWKPKRLSHSKGAKRDLPPPTVYSEWAEAAVMRADWRRASPQFAVKFSNNTVVTELNCTQRVWRGEWEAEVEIGGVARPVTSGWEEVCWFSDHDVDYLELEAELTEGWCIQRQMLLARKDDFLLLADAVVGDGVESIRYRSSLALAPDVQFVTAEESTEGVLNAHRALGLVLPLGLPEWRAERGPGTLEASADRLVLSQQFSGRALYAPLFFDLAPRTQAPYTWRQLTVAEQLQIQRRDVAAGFRVQLGKRQWLIYRSLAPRRNRSVLGQNLSQEFVVARFKRDGTIDELLQVE